MSGTDTTAATPAKPNTTQEAITLGVAAIQAFILYQRFKDDLAETDQAALDAKLAAEVGISDQDFAQVNTILSQAALVV
jgi:predicted nucleotide-binding protein